MILANYFKILSILFFYKTISVATYSEDHLNTFNNELISNENQFSENIEILKCTKQSKKGCNTVPIECMKCSIDENPRSADCIYGEPIETNCTVNKFTKCQGERSFVLKGICRFCYQTPDWMHVCTRMTKCRRDSWIRLFKVNCTVDDHVVCLGSRTFNKKVECNWTSGYKRNVALLLSIFLGGFGVDRFYLGHYKEGLGKLFSFGGLGVWTLIDIFLIYVGYIGPIDGSIYI